MYGESGELANGRVSRDDREWCLRASGDHPLGRRSSGCLRPGIRVPGVALAICRVPAPGSPPISHQSPVTRGVTGHLCCADCRWGPPLPWSATPSCPSGAHFGVILHAENVLKMLCRRGESLIRQRDPIAESRVPSASSPLHWHTTPFPCFQEPAAGPTGRPSWSAVAPLLNPVRSLSLSLPTGENIVSPSAVQRALGSLRRCGAVCGRPSVLHPPHTHRARG